MIFFKSSLVSDEATSLREADKFLTDDKDIDALILLFENPSALYFPPSEDRWFSVAKIEFLSKPPSLCF